MSQDKSLYRFVKANERLPEMQTRVVLKHIGGNTIHLGNFDGNEEGIWLYVQCSDSHAGWSVADEGNNFENWEWLEEVKEADQQALWEDVFKIEGHQHLNSIREILKSKYTLISKQ